MKSLPRFLFAAFLEGIGTKTPAPKRFVKSLSEWLSPEIIKSSADFICDSFALSKTLDAIDEYSTDDMTGKFSLRRAISLK
jgi:hypothetical protein